jgi:hypothetical protein
MNLHVEYSGSSGTLMHADVVVVKKKPGTLDVNDMTDYLKSYLPSERKEGRLREDGNVIDPQTGNVEYYYYDLNPNKNFIYDLLIFIDTQVGVHYKKDANGDFILDEKGNRIQVWDAEPLDPETVCIGYAEITSQGLGLAETKEVLKVKYILEEGEKYTAVLDLDFRGMIPIIGNYITTEPTGNDRTYSKEYINSQIEFSPRLASTLEAYNDPYTIAPTYKGYLYQGEYYELESLDLNLKWDGETVYDMRIKLFGSDYWLEVTYSSRKSILHNVSKLPASTTPLISLVDGVNTILVDWGDYLEVVLTPNNMYHLPAPEKGVTHTWVQSKTIFNADKRSTANPRPHRQTNLKYSKALGSTISPGIVVDNPEMNVVFSKKEPIENWCMNKEVRDRMLSLNTFLTDDRSDLIIWDNNYFSYSYQVKETDMEIFIVREYTANRSTYRAFFPDKTVLPMNAYVRSSETIIDSQSVKIEIPRYKLIGKGELLVENSDGSLAIYSGGKDKVTQIKLRSDLADLYFGSFDRPISIEPVKYNTTLIHNGKFYFLDTNYNLR